VCKWWALHIINLISKKKCKNYDLLLMYPSWSNQSFSLNYENVRDFTTLMLNLVRKTILAYAYSVSAFIPPFTWFIHSYLLMYIHRLISSRRKWKEGRAKLRLKLSWKGKKYFFLLSCLHSLLVYKEMNEWMNWKEWVTVT
jgi:hypothetical protein